jgi:hypothetical protein
LRFAFFATIATSLGLIGKSPRCVALLVGCAVDELLPAIGTLNHLVFERHWTLLPSCLAQASEPVSGATGRAVSGLREGEAGRGAVLRLRSSLSFCTGPSWPEGPHVY